MLLIVRTKHGPIRWPPPQWCPLQSPPQHPPHPLAADLNALTHRGDLPPCRKWATAGWTTTSTPHPDVPPELLTSREGMKFLPSSMHWQLFLRFAPNRNSEAWEELLVLSLLPVCSLVRPSLANCLRWSCSCLHWSGYSCLGTVDGCIRVIPPYP